MRVLTYIDSAKSLTVATGVGASNAELRPRPKNSMQIWALMFTLVLTGALSGCAAEWEYEECGRGDCPNDGKITAEVRHALAQHPDLGRTDTVYVDTINHVVYLTGTVNSGLQRQGAESVARTTSGVTRVVDNISIGK